MGASAVAAVPAAGGAIRQTATLIPAAMVIASATRVCVIFHGDGGAF